MATPPFRVKATFEYNSEHSDDLNFPVGQIITVTEEEDTQWYFGNYTDGSGAKLEGLFPKSFVEKYEPAAPPRPSRTRPKKETAESVEETTLPTQKSEEPPSIPASAPAPVALPVAEATEQQLSPPPPAVTQTKAPEPKSEPVKAAAGSKGPPPAVAQKPSSFRDRIAHFNKGTETPLAPIKPGPPSAGSSYLVKKPFVAPPPARNAYVPPPRQQQAVQKTYRWGEDPEAVERQAQDLEDASKAGLIPSEDKDEAEEDMPKATSLKDRIALLQKQQQEQAARRAELAHKEKPKKPVKKRTESSERIAAPSGDTEPEEVGVGESDQLRVDRNISRDPRIPEQPPRELQSDENDADQSGAGDTTEDNEGESTEVEEHDSHPKQSLRSRPSGERTPAAEHPPLREGDDVSRLARNNENEEDEDEDEEEEEMDAETRRKMELRDRMAKMSGGMGMPGMFGPLGGMAMHSAAPKKKKSASTHEDTGSGTREPPTSPPATAPRVPMVPIPGLQRVRTPEVEDARGLVEKEPERSPPLSKRDPQELPDVEDVGSKQVSINERTPPPIPQDRTVPIPPSAPPRGAAPPVPGDRPRPTSIDMRAPPPPPPPRMPETLAEEGHQDEEETSKEEKAPSMSPPRSKRESQVRGPPPPVPSALPPRPEGPRSPPASTLKRMSQVPQAPPPAAPSEKRASRVPPVPSAAPAPEDLRPAPPPPPTAPPARRSIDQRSPEQISEDEEEVEEEGGESDYEGDYDTDIAPGASHRDALKAHQRTPSHDDDNFLEESPLRSSQMNQTTGSSAANRAPPPPPPHQAPLPRRSVDDASRVAAPAPPSRPPVAAEVDDEYDPYKYAEPLTTVQSRKKPSDDPVQPSDMSLYGGQAESHSERLPLHTQQSSPRERVPPPPPSGSTEKQVMQSPTVRQSVDMGRPSADVSRPSMSAARRSVDKPRSSMEQGQIAQDMDLGLSSLWWTQSNTPPPVLQSRTDVLCEYEEASASKRGGRATTSRDVYALFQDYSQTIVSARFDPKSPQEAVVEQRHEPPPARPRQEQLESAHSQFGQKILTAASAKQNQVVGDGAAISLIQEILKTLPNVLLPVGNRAFGALIYANMGNASVMQHDEIRPGDIISFRNAKFQGKHGPMHNKYSDDVGKPDHVGVVAEWDGTKRKVRAFEQGREKSKIRVESFRIGDLRSGEVKVWRVMSREWVGWES